MSTIGKLAFAFGLLLSLVAAHVDLGPAVWLVGGLGIVAGLLNITATETKAFLLAGVSLVVALTAILAQEFNPDWLSNTVFFFRVFVAHVLLVVALLQVFKTAHD